MDSIDKYEYFSVLRDEYLLYNFINPLSKYNINYFNEIIEENDKNGLIASIIFNKNGVTIPFQYKLTDEQTKLYNENKNDVIDTIVWYIFDYYTCKHLVETYGIFEIIKKVMDKYGIETMANVYKNKNSEELYYYYTYYILLDYFDNIVYHSSKKKNIASIEDINNLERIINNI